MDNMEKDVKKLNILLLTNRDSDNIGDQVIEANDIALLHAVMKNLQIPKHMYRINSRTAAIVTKKYMATRNAKYLETAEKEISEADLVLFGGAPVFNYAYQNFYERTAITLELAQKYNKPVIFSAVGVESYDEESEKCQRLKAALNLDCVKQITTRDGFENLQNYKENENLSIGLVSDPAVFSGDVFRSLINKDKAKAEKKKIGIFVLRSNGFSDNQVDFSREDACELWVNLINELESRGYDCELLTSGHFGDEAFLDYLIRQYDLPQGKYVFNMNQPESLIKKMSEYDGIVSCRLHPSIISFAMNIPAVSLVWNVKVTGFYKGIGYPQRAIMREDFRADAIADRLEQAMAEGIQKDKEYLVSVYKALFTGIHDVFCPEDQDMKAYSYDELVEVIQPYKGTSQAEAQRKLTRKFRRVYDLCNRRLDQNTELRKKAAELEEETRQLKREVHQLKKEVHQLKEKARSCESCERKEPVREKKFSAKKVVRRCLNSLRAVKSNSDNSKGK